MGNKIFSDFRSLVKGLSLTWMHLKNWRRRRKPMAVGNKNYFGQKNGLVTIQYPHEKIPVPDVGRYRLHLDTPDCIGCDQCARICPVDCIEIVKIKSPDVIGTTSDGTNIRFYLPVFDIDMAKCCYCGLCTIVCPTECLTMSDIYDYSSTERDDFILHFGNLTPEEAVQKQKEIDQYEEEKKAAKKRAIEESNSGSTT